jgi:hypothetical protein
MGKWLSRKLAVVIVAGAVIIIHPEIAYPAALVAIAYILGQAWIEGRKVGK